MAVKNVECQLVQGKIGRYLNGDRISPETVKQLEEHIAECAECTEKLLLRRQAIVAAIADSPPARAVVEMASSEPAVVETAANRLIAALKKTDQPADSGTETSRSTEAPKVADKKRANHKPLIYSAGLAVVLILMSYFGKAFSDSLGPKASALLPTRTPAPQSNSKPSPTTSAATVRALHPMVADNVPKGPGDASSVGTTPTPISPSETPTRSHPESKPTRVSAPPSESIVPLHSATARSSARPHGVPVDRSEGHGAPENRDNHPISSIRHPHLQPRIRVRPIGARRTLHRAVRRHPTAHPLKAHRDAGANPVNRIRVYTSDGTPLN